MSTIPSITITASFLDALMYIQHKMHTAPNAAAAKKRICKSLNIPVNAPYSIYAGELAIAMIEGGQGDKVNRILKQMGFKISQNPNGLFEVIKSK